MLDLVWPEWRVAREWPLIAKTIAKAVALDRKRDWFDVAGNLLKGTLQAWKVKGGYVVTEINKRGTFWVIYAAGEGGSFADKRAMMAELEGIGKQMGCTDAQFEGRDWRKVFPDYEATKDASGRWHYRKEL